MTLGILRILGIIVFVYLIWRDLKDDYNEQKIIGYSWLALIGFLVLGRIFFGLIHWGVWNINVIDWLTVWNKPGMSYIGGYLGLALVTWIYGKKQQWKILAFMEGVLKPVLVLMGFLIIDEWLRSKMDWRILIYLLIIVVAYIVSIWVGKRYRSFVWYKSGKKGFVFLFINFLTFLLLVIDLIIFKENIINIILASIISLISICGLFILGEIKYERK
jgi:hypothetical protein